MCCLGHGPWGCGWGWLRDGLIAGYSHSLSVLICYLCRHLHCGSSLQSSVWDGVSNFLPHLGLGLSSDNTSREAAAPASDTAQSAATPPAAALGGAPAAATPAPAAPGGASAASAAAATALASNTAPAEGPPPRESDVMVAARIHADAMRYQGYATVLGMGLAAALLGFSFYLSACRFADRADATLALVGLLKETIDSNSTSAPAWLGAVETQAARLMWASIAGTLSQVLLSPVLVCVPIPILKGIVDLLPPGIGLVTYFVSKRFLA